MQHNSSRHSLSAYEASLLEGLRMGIPEVVVRWHTEFSPKIARYVSQKIDRESDVEEIVQDTFMHALKHLPLFRGNSSIATWLSSIARHEVADFYRRKYAKKAITYLPLGEWLLEDKSESSSESQEIVEQTFKALRPDYRQLLHLKYEQQKKVKEIAQLLNKTVKAIESDLYRARQEFQAEYLLLSGDK